MLQKKRASLQIDVRSITFSMNWCTKEERETNKNVIKEIYKKSPHRIFFSDDFSTANNLKTCFTPTDFLPSFAIRQQGQNSEGASKMRYISILSVLIIYIYTFTGRNQKQP
jgi:hypothetical protein